MKPLSANKMTGRSKTYKTKDYENYQNEIRDELMGVEWPFGDSPVQVHFTAGMTTRAADLDNVMKPLLDTYQVIFEGFNDNKVYKLTGIKEVAGKGNEFLEVTVERYDDE